MNHINLDDIELSVRALKALKDLGAVTLADAQSLIIERKLHKQKGVGPRTVREVQEIVDHMRPITLHATPSDDYTKGMEAERAAAVAYLKAKARRLDSEDSEGNRAAIGTLCHVIFTLKYGHHWLK